MSKQSIAGFLMVITPIIALVAGGVAAADPLTQEKVTSNGYRVTLSMDNVQIQSVPNMAAAPLVREGFVTANVKLKVDCDKIAKADCNLDREPVTASLWVYAQVGCSMEMNDGIKLAPGGSLVSGLPGTLGELLPEGGDITNINITPTLSGLTPGSLEVTTRPGYITDVRMGSKSTTPRPSSSAEVTAPRQVGVAVSVTNRHIVVNRRNDNDPGPTACGGPVAIRMRAQGLVRTPTSVDTLDMFGDIYSL